ncbi:MAG: XdhC family protein [Thermoanaerobaculia bacterium]
MRGEIYERLAHALAAEELLAQATALSGPGAGAGMLIWPDGRTAGELASAVAEARARAIAEQLLRVVGTRRATVEVDGGTVELFVQVHAPRPQLVIVGGGHVAEHLVRLASELDYRTVVVDPRAAFATPERFAAADRLIQEWPARAFAELQLHEATSVAVLSHDLKLDVPALKAALAGAARYVGALGSKKTQGRRAAALREAGVPEERIARIRSPIGLDLGGRRPDEIALAILAEIVAARHGKDISG